MKRFNVVRDFIACLNDNDVAIFSNELLNKEAFQYDRSGNMYVSTPAIALSIGIGIAIGTTKRVFIFCEDNDFIEHLGIFAQAAASQCKNIIYVIFNSGGCRELSELPNIFGSLYSPKGILLNLGFRVHDYTHFFNNSKEFKSDKTNTIKRIGGPLAVIIKVDKGIKKIENDVISNEVLKQRINNFIVNF